MDAEAAHGLAIAALKWGLGPRFKNDPDPVLRTKVFGLDFPNPVGLAAGFDKHGEAAGACLGLGFGHVELGSVTPRPQPGNPKPRMFRIPGAEAVINRFGFNSVGFDALLPRLRAWRESNASALRGLVGVNVGKNKETENAAEDYTAGIAAFAPYADYLAINVSSPNTPGLRNLQERKPLAELLQAAMEARRSTPRKPPLLVKIAPDLTEGQMEDIAEVVLASGVDGMIVGNTTVSRPDEIPPELAKEAGGLSGRPLFGMSTRVLSRMYSLTQGKVPLIGCGGIFSAEDAYAKIRAGASLVQLYTGLVYEGPCLVARINRGLAALLKRDGFRSVADAVGAAHKG